MIGQRTMRALVIEDDPDDWFLCEDVASDVTSVDIELAWEADPVEAVARAEAGTWDALLIDYRLGETTGAEVMAELRDRGVSTPIVFLTGQIDPDLERYVMRHGADDYLGKWELSPRSLERALAHAVERRRYVRSIEAREAQYRAVLAALHEGVLAFDARGRVTSANDRAAQMLDTTVRDLLGSDDPLAGWSTVDDSGNPLPPAANPWTRVLGGWIRAMSAVIGLDGEGRDRRWLSVDVLPLEAPGREAAGAVASIRDVTEARREHQDLLHRAFHDPLTGLPNRDLFRDRLEQAMHLAERREQGLAVLFLDLDRFKDINDRWGHAAGDTVLQTFAARVGGVLRAHDTLARIAGDEFVALLQDVPGPDEACLIADRILESLGAEVPLAETHVRLSTSIGIALHPGGTVPAEALLGRADAALYEAKSAGRNTYRVADWSAGTMAASRA